MALGNGALRLAALASVVALGLSGQSNSQPKASAEDARRFVQSFYDWYVPFFSGPDGYAEKAIRQRPELFDNAFLEAFMVDREAQSKCDDLVSLDYDPFLQAQDTDGTYVAAVVQPLAAGFRVTVNASNEPKPWIYADVAFRQGRWRFVDFSRRDGPSVLKVLALLKQDRLKTPCEPRRSSRRP